MKLELPGAGPVAYSVRVSSRARRIRLSLSPGDGLVVVVPRVADKRHVPALLKKHERWLAKHIGRMRDRQLPSSLDEAKRPTDISLPAIDQRWSVEYVENDQGRVRVKEQDGSRLIVRGQVSDGAACRDALRRWLAAKAREHLGPWLQQLSRQTGLTYSAVTIRGQRTRWGSCSARQSISLNYKLLFISPDLVRYVLLHELCHTAVMDHSKKFWRRLEAIEPDCGALNARLRDAWYQIPGWVGQSRR
ncbi:MAG: M48 family metallopeptidase [Sphingomonadales bacterium]